VHQPVRPSWLFGVNRECQILIGEVTRASRAGLRTAFDTFANNLPPPLSEIEATLLRGRLVDLCLRWGDSHHRRYHHANGVPFEMCGMRANDVAAEAWRERSLPASRLFAIWAEEYLRHFSHHHPLDAINELIEELDRNPVDHTIVCRVAQERGVTERSLRANFSKVAGMTVRAYQTRRRVAKAISLLENTRDKVQSVANEVGWASRKDLIRAVRSATGSTPAQIRRNRSSNPD
jgi:AraC-like DNA-binding protein